MFRRRTNDAAERRRADRLTTFSLLHGRRVWIRVGEREHVDKRGGKITWAVWETTCVVCGNEFQFTTLPRVASVENSRALSTVTCPAHRLTKSESGRLRHRRREVFEAIKRAKLARFRPK